MYQPLPREDLDKVLSLTPQFWAQFSGTRVFMTGGTGFLGRWLIETILHANRELGTHIELLLLSRNPDRARLHAPQLFSDPAVTLISGDVKSFVKPVGQFDICLHAAADVGDPGKANDQRVAFESAFLGTRNVLDLSSKSGACRFLLTSSGAVYGQQPPDLVGIPETFSGASDCLRPDMGYGNGKRVSEWLSCEAAASSGLHVGIARIFALLGPGLPLNGPFAAGNFIRNALNRQPIKIQGDGRPIRSYLYMLDACVWLLEILRTGKSGHAYNVGSEHTLSIAELASQVAERTGGTLDAASTSAAANPTTQAPPRYVPDTSKARRELSLGIYTPFDTALQKTIQWSRHAILQ